jgi:uncharacterized protein (TIGR02996 family)
VIAASERDQLIGAVMSYPRESDRKLILSDWLRDHGEDSLARCYRWMAVRSLHPHQRLYYPAMWSGILRRVPDRYSWAWYPSWMSQRERNAERVTDAGVLPAIVFFALAGRTTQPALYGSFGVAVASLAESLDFIERQLEDDYAR